MIPTESQVVRLSNVLWRVASDGVLCLRLGSEAVDLKGMAALVWLELDSATSVRSIRSSIVSRHGDAAGADVDEAISMLAAEGLVEESR